VFLDGDRADTDGETPAHLRRHLVAENRFRCGDPDVMLAEAPHRLAATFRMQRSSTAPLEPRGYVASWDGASWDDPSGRLTVHASHQQPFQLRSQLARMLDLPEESVRVVVPKVGGAFGLKMTGGVEEPLVCLLSRLCGRPVKWIESRAECFLGGGREQVNRVEVGFDDQGRVTVLHDEIVIPVGAESPSPGWRQAYVSAAAVPGGYDIPHVAVRSRVVATNEPPWHSCRGFGKEAPTVVLERTMDLVARALGRDPADVRRINLLRSESLPHRLPSGYAIDSGDFLTVLDKTLALAGYDRAEQPCRDDGLLDGVGIAFEVTPEGGGHAAGRSADLPATVAAPESATVRLDGRGRVQVLSGVTNPGGGNDTALATLAAAELGTTRDAVDVVQGDTDLCPPGTGNASSRGTAVGGAAVVLAARDLALDLRTIAAAALDVPAEQVVLRDGAAHAPSGAAVPFVDLHRRRPSLSRTRSYRPGQERPGDDTAEYRYSYPYFSSGAYVARVTVDPLTGAVVLRSLTAVHDCGHVVDEVLVEGQLQGAVAMGIGLALFETSGFDADGASTTRSFKEYMIPRPNDLPSFTIAHHETPSPNTMLGAKGAGEAGVGGALAAVANAVDDAVAAACGAAVTTFPLSPSRVLALLDDAGQNRCGSVSPGLRAELNSRGPAGRSEDVR
jgi:CO/xanthine dehydrogenase Mo-binding subunit